jgi:hypothetical protein
MRNLQIRLGLVVVPSNGQMCDKGKGSAVDGI